MPAFHSRLIRPARRRDLAAILRIQRASPRAAQWVADDYKPILTSSGGERCLVAEFEGEVAGFLVYRPLEMEEIEILNLAVTPGCRRAGLGRELIGSLPGVSSASLLLEVRAGNKEALCFYESLGFEIFHRRAGYYRNPPEDALLMRRPPASAPGSPPIRDPRDN